MKTFRQKIELDPRDNKQTFVLEGRLVFKADNITDAFLQLKYHFDNLACEEDSDIALVGTDITINPEKE